MALATRPKPTVHHRKRRAQHHRQSKGYLRAYHPYLPMLAIVGVGFIVNQALYGVNLGSTNLLTNAPQATTRIEALTGQSGALLVVVALTLIAAIILVATHWYRFRRVINRGEAYVAHHFWLDVVLVAVLTAGVILTRYA